MYIFETDGDYVNFNGGGNLWRIHKSSNVVRWHWDETGDLFFDVYDQQYVVKRENISTITIGGISLSVASDFETNIKKIFPGSYKVYTALLTQSGILDPVVTVPTGGNTLGASVTWIRASEGVYDGRVPINGIFNDDSKVAIPGFGWGSGTGVYNIIGAPFTDAYTVFTYSDVNGDGIIEVIFVDSTGAVKDLSAIANINIYIEIRVYP